MADSDREDNSSVAKGAGLAFLGRLGALIDIATLSAFIWLYGSVLFGVYATLWSFLRIMTAIAEMAMTTSLQRFVPATEDEDRVHSILKSALLISFSVSITITLLIFLLTEPLLTVPEIIGYLDTTEIGAEQLKHIIRIYIWVLPLWTMVEVLTSAVRARRKFGPEIRVRIFYEQGLRLTAGVSLFFFGVTFYGIFLAHVFSVFAAAILALSLACRFYSFKKIIRTPIDREVTRDILSFALLMMPGNVIKRLVSDLPVLLLKGMLPGDAGAHAAAFYFTGRKIASILQVIRQSFEYVVAPFASLKNAMQEPEKLNEIYTFSTRLVVSLLLPLAGLVILLREEILLVFRPEFMAASSVILILAIGRLIEAATGPASAITEMLGAKYLPFLNGVAGVTVLAILQRQVLDPSPMSAAISAAAGLSVVNILSVLENKFLYGYSPYRSDMWRPITFSLFLTLVLGTLGLWAAKIDPFFGVFTAFGGSFLAFFLVVRYGLGQKDVEALGWIGRTFGRKNAG